MGEFKKAVSDPKTVDRLLKVDRGLTGAMFPGTGRILMQRFRDLEEPGLQQEIPWVMFNRMVHEITHLWAHRRYDGYFDAPGLEVDVRHAAIESVNCVLAEIVNIDIERAAGEQRVREAVEAEYAQRPPLLELPHPAETDRYESHPQAMRLISLVGVLPVVAAYVQGHVNRITGEIAPPVPVWPGAERDPAKEDDGLPGEPGAKKVRTVGPERPGGSSGESVLRLRGGAGQGEPWSARAQRLVGLAGPGRPGRARPSSALAVQAGPGTGTLAAGIAREDPRRWAAGGAAAGQRCL